MVYGNFACPKGVTNPLSPILNFPVGTRGFSRECVLCIPMRVVKGDLNGEVDRNNRKKGDPVSVLGRVR